MRNGRSVFIRLSLGLVWAAACSGQESAPMPSMENAGHTYRIVPRPLAPHVGKHLPYSTTNQPTPPPSLEARPTGPYAYGWFGVQPSPHWSRHFGFSRRYTQWTLK